MFLGWMDEGIAATFPFPLAVNGVPVVPDSTPTFRVLGADGVVTSGTGNLSLMESGSITGATQATPIVITSATHRVSTGQLVYISGVLGNTAANGTFVATFVDANTFSISATGNGAYTSGGTWSTKGLYKVVLSGAILSTLEAGKTYTIVVTFTVSAVTYTVQASFTVR